MDELTQAQEDRVEQKLGELDIAVQETVADMADNPDIEVSEDDIAHDMLSAVLWDETDNAVAREVCRRTMGMVPFDLMSRLGDIDWVQ